MSVVRARAAVWRLALALGIAVMAAMAASADSPAPAMAPASAPASAPAAPATVSPPTPATDPWQPVRFLLGKWRGTVQGEAGNGTVARNYEFVLGNRFIEERNVSTYPAQEKNRKGEVHEHRSFISYDRARRRLVLRQFHQEGFVNTYAFNAAESSANVLVFDSESFENLDAAYGARETYELSSNDEFVETFEVAEPGKPLETYSRTRFTRVGRAAGE